MQYLNIKLGGRMISGKESSGCYSLLEKHVGKNGRFAGERFASQGEGVSDDA